MEEQVFRKGLHKIPSMLDYKSPTTLEMPPVESILVETLDPEGPYGAKECGQGPLLPVIPAVANALFDALGVRIDEVPITPEKVLAALDGRYRRPQHARVRSTRRRSVASRPLRRRPRRRTRTRRCGHESASAEAAAVRYRAPRHRGATPRACSRDHGPEAMAVAGGTDLYPEHEAPPVRRRKRAGRRCAASHEAHGIAANGGLAPRRDGHPHRSGRPSRPCARAGRPSRAPPGSSRRRRCATRAPSAATSASTRAATTTTSPSSGGPPSATA